MKTVWLSLAVVLFAGGLARAQWGRGYYDSYHASTAAEGAARGLADMARSAGQYNVLTSEAAINMTEAQKNHIANRELWTNTYFEMRRANQAYRHAERKPQMSHEARVRWAQAGRPKPLSPSDLDVVDGSIDWPMLLTADQFAPYREKLDKSFAQRAEAGTTTWENYQRIEQASKEMHAELKKQIRSVSSSQYMAAKYFIDSLLFEAKNPAA